MGVLLPIARDRISVQARWMMKKRKYVKYKIVETGEIKTLYEEQNPYLYEMTFDQYGKENLPFLNRFNDIIFLEFGESYEK